MAASGSGPSKPHMAYVSNGASIAKPQAHRIQQHLARAVDDESRNIAPAQKSMKYDALLKAEGRVTQRK